ncbi:MAG: hypothetical protein D6775_00800, partial [Caldilineae bacterium]
MKSNQWMVGVFSFIAAAVIALTVLASAGPATLVADSPPERGMGPVNGPVDISLDRANLIVFSAPELPVATEIGQSVILSEDFEGTWPAGSWQAFDNDAATNGEYFWANRCAGHNSSRSAWAVGGGAQGSSLTCGGFYPDNADSWMVYGPFDLTQATSASMDYYFRLQSECAGTDCSDKKDQLWALATTDFTNYVGWWYAGNWIQDPRADPNGWVQGTTVDMSSLTGQSQVWVLFVFSS